MRVSANSSFAGCAIIERIQVLSGPIDAVELRPLHLRFKGNGNANADAVMKPTGTETLLPCPRCARADQLRLAQTVIRSRLRWYESTHCSGCGFTQEADAIGLPPPAIRAHLLATDGRWALVLQQAKSAARAARVLRDCLALDSSEAIALTRQPGGILFQGSATECAWLGEALARVGEETRLQLLPD